MTEQDLSRITVAIGKTRMVHVVVNDPRDPVNAVSLCGYLHVPPSAVKPFAKLAHLKHRCQLCFEFSPLRPFASPPPRP